MAVQEVGRGKLETYRASSKGKRPPTLTVYIYALCDPDTDDIFYVGSSLKPNFRLYAHEGDGRRKCSRKAVWLRGLADQGIKPRVEVLDTTDLDNRHQVEWAWILWLLSEGYDLTNDLPGEWRLRRARSGRYNER